MVRIGGPLRPGGQKPGSLPSRSGSTHNMAANVKVVVRVRPPNAREQEANNRVVVDIVDEQMLVFDPKEEQRPFFYQGIQQPNKNFLKRANKELRFAFDHVCGHEATNQNVFEKTTKEILTSLMEGYNCSVFVYGATGAGKTFTMIGTQENPGITYLTMEHLFYSINSFEKDREFDIGVSYIEVYNENVYDLLNSTKVPLQLREDSKYGVVVVDMTMIKIKTAQQLLDMLANGNKNRTQHPTDANAESSRSHAVFQVYITMKNKVSSQVRMVKLSMIDLAGSERASATGCIGERFKEGANINRSLLSLGNCINKLADGSNYIPYRDSKLTRLLKDSLGGNCKTVMIANISPSSMCYEDTYNTLKYAARANKIQLNIKKNIVDTNMRVSEYVKANEELKKSVKELKAQLAAIVPTVVMETDPVKDKANQEWRQRLKEAAKEHANVESCLLSLMSQQRVLALRHRLKTRAFSHIVELAHRSSMEGMDQMCTEDIPRHERATDHYLKQSIGMDAKIVAAWTKWNNSKDKLQQLCTQALSEIRELDDFINNIQLEAKIRQLEARDNLRHKLVLIENDEINAFANYMSDMPSMLKKLYLTLKGYEKATPGLTNEYLEIMKKAKSSKGISWSDNLEVSSEDAHFRFIANLDLDKLTSIPDFPSNNKTVKEELNRTIEINTDSDELTDIENREPLLRKRKGTPIKLPNNETIIIDDSLDQLDVTRNLSAKKIKSEFDISKDVENIEGINPMDLNSTFVLAGKMEALKKNAENTLTSQPLKKGLVDRTNTMQRSVVINPNARAKVVKPLVGKAMPFRRPATAPAAATPALNARKGFGSTLTRDGRPLQQNNVQAVRGRERTQAHPYSRPTFASSRR